jgi:lysophospholipase L1-like esterase
MIKWMMVLVIAIFLQPVGVSRANAGTRRVVFVGDSLTANLGLSPRQMLPERVEAMLHQHILAQSIAAPGATMSNYGFQLGFESLDTLFDVVGGILPMDVVVVLLGTNDSTLSTTDAFRTAYIKLLLRIPGRSAVVCVTPPWNSAETAPNSSGETLQDFRAVIREVCAQKTIVEGVDAIPHDPAYYLPEYPIIRHPNATGTWRLARAIAAALQPIVIGH